MEADGEFTKVNIFTKDKLENTKDKITLSIDTRSAEVAKECFVSPSSISRFCRTLGYDNFAHLKQECYSFHSNDKKFNNLIHIPATLMNNNPKEATKEYISKVED